MPRTSPQRAIALSPGSGSRQRSPGRRQSETRWTPSSFKLPHDLVHQEGDGAADGIGPMAKGLHDPGVAVAVRIAGDEAFDPAGAVIGPGDEKPLSSQLLRIESALQEPHLARLRLALQEQVGDAGQLGDQARATGRRAATPGGTPTRPGRGDGRSSSAGGPIRRISRPGAAGQIDQGLFAPLRRLEPDLPEQRQLFSAMLKKVSTSAVRLGVINEFGQAVLG